jgi:hypothetical protein
MGCLNNVDLMIVLAQLQYYLRKGLFKHALHHSALPQRKIPGEVTSSNSDSFIVLHYLSYIRIYGFNSPSGSYGTIQRFVFI